MLGLKLGDLVRLVWLGSGVASLVVGVSVCVDDVGDDVSGLWL